MRFTLVLVGLVVAAAGNPTDRRFRFRRQRNSTSTTGLGPVTNSTTFANTTEPCALASQAAAAYAASVPPGEPVFIKPSLALACLESVPVDVERDLALLEYIEPFLEFQSTIDFLKQPPKGYLVPGVDVFGGLKQIRQKLLTGAYASQYEFGWDLHSIFVQSADGHFVFPPAIVRVFDFMRDSRVHNVVSISNSSTGLPQVFEFHDLVKANQERYVPSPIETIDGVAVVEYLEQIASLGPSHDPDGQYNGLFISVTSIAQGGPGWYSGEALGQYRSLPDQTVVGFLNGTVVTRQNLAKVVANLDGIGSGPELHEKLEVPSPTPPESTPTPTPPSNQTTPATTQLPGYPPPLAIHKQNGCVSGYFINDTMHSRVAVLSILSFSDNDPTTEVADVEEFRAVVSKFLNACRNTNKSKLVLDLRTNPGGNLASVYDLAKQLFPDLELWGGHRLRAHPVLDWLGSNITAVTGLNDTQQTLFHNVLDKDLNEFPTWPSIFGPDEVTAGGDPVTHLLRWNFPAFTPPITGYSPSLPAPSSRPFAPEDIVILTDGNCASSCATFVGLLAREVGVRTIAVGGRPLQLPMQAIGGVKGEEVKSIDDYIVPVIQAVLKVVTGGTVPYRLTIPSPDPPPLKGTGGRVNYRNAYARNNTSGTPLQFVYEAANCRIFYTAKTGSDVVKMWSEAADIAWRGGACVLGSTTNDDGTMGWETLPYSDAVMSRAKPYEGPGSLVPPSK